MTSVSSDTVPGPPQHHLQQVRPPTSASLIAFQDAMSRTRRHMRIHERILPLPEIPGLRGQSRLPGETRASRRRRNQDQATLAQLGYDTNSDSEFGRVETFEQPDDEPFDEPLREPAQLNLLRGVVGQGTLTSFDVEECSTCGSGVL
ncbi:hypothetical protein HD806DRAFT_537216 [Xylariaceae sp. AK1471]|nr:hypothetical protein HD806DRAFT_537216 [Xylariaceae sp. AK1471]